MVQCGKSIITDGTVKSMNDLEVLKAACCIAGLDEDVGFKDRKVLQSLAERAGVDQAAFDAMMVMAVEDDDYFEGQLNILQSNVDDAIKSLFRFAVMDVNVALSKSYSIVRETPSFSTLFTGLKS